MATASTVKIVLIDDHDLIREGVRDFLAALPEYEVVGEARTARAGFHIIQAVEPDIVLMDLALPGMDGVVATREILRRSPRTHVVVLSAHEQLRDVMDAMDAGAVAYVLKADPLDTLIEALDHAAHGFPYLAPTLAARLSASDPSRGTDGILDVLSEREREIFRLAADCSTPPEIARELCIARKTVDTHLDRINRKLGLHARAELVRLAVDIGLVHSIRSAIPAPRRPVPTLVTAGVGSTRAAADAIGAAVRPSKAPHQSPRSPAASASLTRFR
jgi:two-component system, NarL family, response regulator LiaR